MLRVVILFDRCINYNHDILTFSSSVPPTPCLWLLLCRVEEPLEPRRLALHSTSLSLPSSSASLDCHSSSSSSTSLLQSSLPCSSSSEESSIASACSATCQITLNPIISASANKEQTKNLYLIAILIVTVIAHHAAPSLQHAAALLH